MTSTVGLLREFDALCNFILGGTDKKDYDARVRAIRRLPTVIDLLAEHGKLTAAMLAKGQ